MSLPVPTGDRPRPDARPDDHFRRQLETVANNATLALFVMDERQRCTYMNPAAERLTGYTLAEVQGGPLHDYVHHTRPDGTPYPLAECPIDRALPTRMREQGEEVFVHKDGHFFPVAFTASPILEEGRAVGTIIEVRGVAEERARAAERERLLAERERLTRQVAGERERLARIFDDAPAMISVTRGADHVFELANPAYRAMIGGRDVIGKTVRDALPEAVAQGFLELRDELYRTGRTHVQSEARVLVDADGDGVPEEHFFDFITQPLRNADGEVDGVLTFAVAVTEQVRARRQMEEQAVEMESLTEELQDRAVRLEEIQAELEVSNEELLEANREAEEARAVLEAFFDCAPVAAAHLDRELRYRRMNPELAAIDGVDREAVIGRSIREVIPHGAPELEEFYRRVLETGEAIRGVEVSVPRPTQLETPGHYLVNYFPIRIPGEEPIGVGLVALDVTDEREATERERVFSQVMEESRNEIYMFDAETLRFVRVNRGARENLGYSMEELRSLTPVDLKPSLSAEAFAAMVQPLRDGTLDVLRFETEHRRRDGSLYPVDVHLQLSRVADPPLFVALILDTTEQKRAGEERDRLFEAERASRERIQVLADAGTVLASSLDPAATLEQLARIVVPALADWCFVEIPDPQGRIEPVAVYHCDPERVALAHRVMQRFPVDPEAAHGTARVLRTGEPELISEIPEAVFEAVAQDEEHLELLRGVGFRSHVAVPLRVRDRVVGVLSLVQAESGRRFGPEDLPYVDELARKAALALDNARLFEEAERARRAAEREAERLDRLHTLAAALNRAATVEEVARVSVVHGMGALGGAAGSLAVLSPDEAEFEIIHSEGYDDEVRERWRRFPRRAGRPLSDAVLTRAPVLVGTLEEWRERYPAAASDAVRGELLSFAAIPLLIGDRALGALSLSFTAEGPFTESDRAFLFNVGAQAAQALERARLLETERVARNTAERLQTLTAALSAALTTAAVGEAAMEHGVRALHADCGVLALLTPAGDELELVASSGYPEEACMGPGRVWKLDTTIPITEAARTGEPVCIASPEEWVRRYPGGYVPTDSRSAAWAALPVVLGGRPAGALLWTYNAPRPFQADEVGLMETLARICSQALERVRLLETERQARGEAEEANRAKAEFLSSMSHELRTPLNAIGGYVELLQMGIHGPVTDQQNGALERVRRAQEVLLSLINDVLNFARIEAGRLEIVRGPVDAVAILDALGDLVAPQVEAKSLQYRYQRPDAPVRVVGDAERIRQILVNLLSNAVKFTRDSGVITLSAEPREGRVAIRVADTGRGIPPDKLETIFDPFVQIDRHRTTESQQGVGLGLAISRELARAMSGDITVESTVDVGSTFTLILPAEPADG